jgi:biopolymer transport protein ExbD
MKLGRQSNEDDLELDMSPMIDMVFLLLIFFIVVSQVIDEKPRVEIPEATYAKVPEDTTGRLMITVMRDESVFIAAEPQAQELDAVKERIEQEINANPRLRILIRADGAVPYEVNEKIMNACAEVGALDIIFSVFEK